MFCISPWKSRSSGSSRSQRQRGMPKTVSKLETFSLTSSTGRPMHCTVHAADPESPRAFVRARINLLGSPAPPPSWRGPIKTVHFRRHVDFAHRSSHIASATYFTSSSSRSEGCVPCVSCSRSRRSSRCRAAVLRGSLKMKRKVFLVLGLLLAASELPAPTCTCAAPFA